MRPTRRSRNDHPDMFGLAPVGSRRFIGPSSSQLCGLTRSALRQASHASKLTEGRVVSAPLPRLSPHRLATVHLFRGEGTFLRVEPRRPSSVSCSHELCASSLYKIID